MNNLGVGVLGVAVTVGAIGIASWLEARRKAAVPIITMVHSLFNERVVSLCPTLNKKYEPMPFLTNGHVETIFAAWFRRLPNLKYRRECLTMPDNGSIALDWCIQAEASLPPSAPILILLPGLTGGSDDSYIQHAVLGARKVGIRAVVFNSRGTAHSPVTSPQFYSASFTDDLRAVIRHVRSKFPPPTPIFAAGWSLGANILVRYLGEEGSATPLTAAVSMCNPLELTISNANFSKGFNRIYDINLARSLSRIFRQHQALWADVGPPFQPQVAAQARSIHEFDDAVTIHSFGWPSVEEYYAGSSSALSLPAVRIPLLCLQALDDPIAPKEAIPYTAFHSNERCILATTPTGGHLGWVAGPSAPFGAPWSDAVALEFIMAVLQEQGQDVHKGEESETISLSVHSTLAS